MKKIIHFLKKYQLVIGLALLASLIASYKLLFPPPPEPTPSAPRQPTPSPVPASGRGISETEFARQLKQQFPLDQYLPYPGPEFIIRYLAPLKLEIIIKQATSAAMKQKALDWIRAQGVDPKSHQIIWRPPL